jgi:hypothetical protein
MRKALLSAFVAGALGFGKSAYAETMATITVYNKTNAEISVSIDGGAYFCQTTSHSNCPRPFPIGHHSLRATRLDNNVNAATEFDLSENGHDWTPFPEEKAP